MTKASTILCDWVDEVKHFNLPLPLRSKLSELCSKYDFKLEFIDKNIKSVRPDVVACIGNKFSEPSLELMPNLNWVQFGSIGTDKISEKIAKKER